jgi:2-polyprenyl-3-methyl-5-hydroxy-6-metoxy-1,4-benzoquinol methylase
MTEALPGPPSVAIRPHRLVPGTEGYAEQAGSLIERWQRLSFSDKPKAILDLIPARPSWILNVGAGIGVDARAMAEMGHSVVAVEPTDELREAGMTLHKSVGIEWVADGLPDLDLVVAKGWAFDVVAAWAVWMHLDDVAWRCQEWPV